MFRYVALLWTPEDHDARANADQVVAQLRQTRDNWEISFSDDGVLVLHAGIRPPSSNAYLLPDRRGVVLGNLFSTDAVRDNPKAPSLSAFNLGLRLAPESRAESTLITRYWGRYVAILKASGSGSFLVLRDPSGALPCLVMQHHALTIVFSDIHDLVEAWPVRLSVNWEYVAAHVCSASIQTTLTGLHGVIEVFPGEQIKVQSGRILDQRLAWDPMNVARTSPVESFGHAVDQLRSVTTACISAWSSCYPRVVHLLSGGLDSSIVLSVLRLLKAGADITCINYFYAPATDEDERIFARIAAAHASCELLEEEESLTDPQLRRIFDIRRSPKPSSLHYQLRHSRGEAELARSRGATAIFEGVGGDQVFYQNPAALAAVDYAYFRGIGSGLLETAISASRIEGTSVWPILAQAVRLGLVWTRWNPLSDLGKYQELVSPEVRQAVRRNEALIHPWLRNHSGLPRGKLWHILMLSVFRDFYGAFGRSGDPERVQPLLSQPLMELCLRIPTYILTQGGRDRAVARAAFQGLVPREVLSRRRKGGIDRYLRDLLQRNSGFVRELMLDGLLVRERLLDRRKVEALFKSNEHLTLSPAAGELFVDHLSTEAWLRSWMSRSERMAA